MPADARNDGALRPSERLGLSAPIKVADVLDIVAIADGDAVRREQMLRELFSLHHARAIAGMQIAFAPAVVAALALASRGASLALVLVAAGLLAAGVLAGLWRVTQLHRFDRKVVLASTLAKAVSPREAELWIVRRRTLGSSTADAPAGDPAARLYREVGHLTLSQCISEEWARSALAIALDAAGLG